MRNGQGPQLGEADLGDVYRVNSQQEQLLKNLVTDTRDVRASCAQMARSMYFISSVVAIGVLVLMAVGGAIVITSIL